ncbi:MAG: hypothetical protein SF187_13450 [Deltaproteobacteria bacterium]|nr:hypothetical protein [Deltaproteobacteria bacterium]
MNDSAGWVGGWTPGIGDPSVAGWVTVFAYAAAAYLCGRAYRRSKHARTPPAQHHVHRAWAALTFGMLALGINKQLDLQTALTEAGRALALQQGWFEGRRVVQAAFVLIVAIVALVMAAWLWLQTRHGTPPLRRAFVGAVALGAFVVIRAASFHHVDLLLGHAFVGLRLNVLLELAGIAWVAFGAASERALRRV